MAALTGAVSAVVTLASGLIDYFKGDKKQEFELALLTLQTEARKVEQEHERLLAQLEVAKEQAKNSNLFVSGAGAFLKWVVGIAVMLQMMLFPIFNWVALFFDENAPQITIDLQNLIKMFLPLFGIGV